MLAVALKPKEAMAIPQPQLRRVERVAQLPALTGLRFFTALLVVFVHYGTSVLPAGPLRHEAQGDAVGVSLFFVLSGFILAYTYLDGTTGVLRVGYPRGTIPPWTATIASLAALSIPLVLVCCTGLPDVLLTGGLLAPLFGLLIYGLAWGRGMLARLLACRPLILLGEASYSLYLLHIPVHQWLERAIGTPSGATSTGRTLFAVYLGLTVALSILCLRLIEEPARRAVRRALS